MSRTFSTPSSREHLVDLVGPGRIRVPRAVARQVLGVVAERLVAGVVLARDPQHVVAIADAPQRRERRPSTSSVSRGAPRVVAGPRNGVSQTDVPKRSFGNEDKEDENVAGNAPYAPLPLQRLPDP